MTIFEILQKDQYNAFSTNVEHPIPLSLSNKMRLEEEQQEKSLTFTHAQPSLTKQVLEDLDMQNKTTEQKYSGYICNYYNFIKN